MTAVSLLLLVHLLASGGVASAQWFQGPPSASPQQDSNPDSSGQSPPYSGDQGSAASPDGTSPAPYQELASNYEQSPSPPSPDEDPSDSAPVSPELSPPPPTEQPPPPTEQQPPPHTEPPLVVPPPPSPQESDIPSGQTWGSNPSPSGQTWGSNPSPSGGHDRDHRSGGGNPSSQSNSWWPWGSSPSSGNPGWWGMSPPPYGNNPGGNPSNPSTGRGTGSGISGPPSNGGSSPLSPTGGYGQGGQGGGNSNSAPPGSTSGSNGPPTTGCGAAGLGPAAAGLNSSTVSSGPPSASSLFGQTYQGIATYYGSQPQKGQGACSVNDANSWSLPWSSGINIPAALTHVQWDGSLPCGQCLAFRATGSGSGRNPLPESYQNAMIVDECPDADCEYGHLDLQINGDGAWGIEWYVMQCAVGSGTFQYSFQGSSAYYVKMQIANTRVPVASVVWNGNQQMQKTGDNYWLLTGSGYSLPAQVAVTSVLGDTVTDTVPSNNGFLGGVNGAGHAQFPAHPEYPTIGGSSAGTAAVGPPGPDSDGIVTAFDGPPSSSGDCGPPADSSQDSPPTATDGGALPTTYRGSPPTNPPPSGGLSFLNNQGLFSSFGRRMKLWKDGMAER